jgi:hypothetical protein
VRSGSDYYTTLPSRDWLGDAYDNPLCKSLVATPECELLDRRRFRR